jgi:hypothetical protein
LFLSIKNITGAYDLLENNHVVLSSKSHRQKTQEDLDGAIHGVNGVWCPEILKKIRRMIHEENFWCHRSADAFIRAFGGPYVLGQDADKLKLVQGAPHNELTKTISRAHNLVYTLVHLKPPAAPGFNTIIFGLNFRRAGFHYHQDSIGEVKGKNVPLVPRQPVVTTVLYERPDKDNEKEIVLWRPILNWSPRSTSNNKDINVGLYQAARALPTIDGTIHVQRAGLQRVAKHGIFHTPTNKNGADDKRMGYRLAITARIAHQDADELIRPFLAAGQYGKMFGPNGDKTLPHPPFDWEEESI